MLGYDYTNRGRYRCKYCKHPSYKTKSGVLHHLEKEHSKDLEIEKLNDRINRYETLPPRIIEKEKIVYRDKPKPEYWYGPAGIYCSSCKTVIKNPGIPVGQTIENTPCECGNRTLMLITRFK